MKCFVVDIKESVYLVSHRELTYQLLPVEQHLLGGGGGGGGGNLSLYRCHTRGSSNSWRETSPPTFPDIEDKPRDHIAISWFLQRYLRYLDTVGISIVLLEISRLMLSCCSLPSVLKHSILHNTESSTLRPEDSHNDLTKIERNQLRYTRAMCMFLETQRTL